MSRLIQIPLRFLDGLLDRVLALVGAIGCAQFPQYLAQYIQRLGGHLDEARRTVLQYQNVAASYNLSLQEYINIHITSDNKIFVSTGKLISGFVERLQHLETAFRALEVSAPWNRWWVFLRVMDPEIAQNTWNNFTPGVPTTIEALFYAGIGLLIGWGIYRGIRALVLLPFRKVASRPPLSGKTGLPV